ncbi:diguanylate cyclase [Neiella marina]|uniref:Diguanylate cyclase n=1 Tax=Neiella holothuriorum TaxID=2870530 RepID=A0ABS7EAQ1_9GAMM|nr:diguanylate cyclase [Neiella holothuriorum]MBW8189409.1 diguanylate cyclase [Neiella holothuriorum]
MSIYKKTTSAVMLVCLLMVSAWASAATIRYIPTEVPKDKYQVELVKFLLSKIDHNYDFVPTEAKSMVISRQISEIQSGNLSFAAISTNEQLERDLRPIRIPVLKGMLGHRVFIIRNGDQNRFNNIQSLSQLKQLTAGQGRFWGSTPIFEKAGIPMVKPTKYASLFYMLEGGRFDYFPRAIHEPYTEVASRPELNLTVEPNLLMVYPSAMYLFTSKENEALAQDLERAFDIAIADGSFDDWFYSHPLIENALAKVRLAERTVINVANPMLPASAPVDRKELWLDVDLANKSTSAPLDLTELQLANALH